MWVEQIPHFWIICLLNDQPVSFRLIPFFGHPAYIAIFATHAERMKCTKYSCSDTTLHVPTHHRRTTIPIVQHQLLLYRANEWIGCEENNTFAEVTPSHSRLRKTSKLKLYIYFFSTLMCCCTISECIIHTNTHTHSHIIHKLTHRNTYPSMLNKDTNKLHAVDRYLVSSTPQSCSSCSRAYQASTDLNGGTHIHTARKW